MSTVILLSLAGKNQFYLCMKYIVLTFFSGRKIYLILITDEMVDIRGGRMLMGTSAADGKDGEFPPRDVKVQSFKIDQYPVTNSDFR